MVIQAIQNFRKEEGLLNFKGHNKEQLVDTRRACDGIMLSALLNNPCSVLPYAAQSTS